MRTAAVARVGLRPGLALAVTGLILGLLSGCSTVPKEYRDQRDPWQPYNRAVFRFNTDFDNAFLKPAAKAWQAITPEPVDRSVTNFFANLTEVSSAVNNALQFKLGRASTSVGRFAVNSTAGIGGLFDVASNLGLQRYKEDFGQTLGVWGIGNGPFVMLPLLGPSTLRDATGRVGDGFIDPTYMVDEEVVMWGLTGLELVDRRADLLVAGEILDEAALDPYSALRDAYLQRRRALLYDGNPPPLEDENVFWE